jgi:hypothetical protein
MRGVEFWNRRGGGVGRGNLHPAGQTESGQSAAFRQKIGAGFGRSTHGGFAPVKAAGRYVDVLPRRKNLKGTGMMDPDLTIAGT